MTFLNSIAAMISSTPRACPEGNQVEEHHGGDAGVEEGEAREDAHHAHQCRLPEAAAQPAGD